MSIKAITGRQADTDIHRYIQTDRHRQTGRRTYEDTRTVLYRTGTGTHTCVRAHYSAPKYTTELLQYEVSQLSYNFITTVIVNEYNTCSSFD